MVAAFGRAGVARSAALASFARPSGPAEGNDLPPITGRVTEAPFRPGPGPRSQGYVVGGQLGANDGASGADPDRPKLSPSPHADVVGDGQETNVRWGIQGFNDRLTVKDRHAYWDTGNQVTGTSFDPAGAAPNTYNNPVQEPPRPDLRTVNRTVSWQIGSDKTRNDDDLNRPYTWLGEQGSGWAPIYGGVPGLYTPYGSRGGVPFPIVDPTSGQGGPEKVWAGPPHGLHSLTFPDYGDTLDRMRQTQQMMPGRFDRPSNSPQAGQSYSQTVQMQGQTGGTAEAQARVSPSRHAGRGWKGRA